MRKVFKIPAKLAFRAIVAILTFGIGFTGYYFVKPVSVCQISQNRRYYDGRTVRIRAFLETLPNVRGYDGEPDIDYITSFQKGCIAGATANYVDEAKNDKVIKELRSYLRNLNNDLEGDDPRHKKVDGWYLAEVEIVAEVHNLSHDGVSPCSIPDLEFKISEVRQVAPVIFFSADDLPKLRD